MQKRPSPHRTLFALLVVLALCATLTGCAEVGMPNPFTPTPASITDVYYSQFADIPIPNVMKSVPANSLVTPSQSGQKVGLETFEGRVETASLANAMIHNMARQGWSLRGSMSGKRTLQLHEKGDMYAVLYFYDQTISTAMEVWVLNRLSGVANIMPYSDPTTPQLLGTGTSPLPSSSTSPSASPLPNAPSPANSSLEIWEGNVKPLKE